MSLLEPPQQLLELLRESLAGSTNIEEEEAGSEDILAYVAFLAAGLCDAQEFTPAAWTEALQPYLERLIQFNGEEPISKFREAAEKITIGEDDNDSYGGGDYEGFEEVCNLRFKYVSSDRDECLLGHSIHLLTHFILHRP